MRLPWCVPVGEVQHRRSVGTNSCSDGHCGPDFLRLRRLRTQFEEQRSALATCRKGSLGADRTS